MLNMLNLENTQLLLQLTARINSAVELDDLLSEIMESAKTIIGGEATSLILHDSESKELVIQYPTGSASSKISGYRIKEDEGIAGWVWKNQEAVIIDDVAKDKRFMGDITDSDFHSKNLICIPLKVGNNRAIGVLQVINKISATSFDQEDQILLEALGHQAAISIERQRLLTDAIQKERQIERERQFREKEAAVAFAKGVEEERARIARELHDHILGIISTTMRKLQQKQLHSPVEETQLTAHETLEELDQLSSEIRLIMEDLKPMSLSHFGLSHAIEILSMRLIDSSEQPIRLKFNLDIDDWTSNEFEQITMYRIIQELISNAICHAEANLIEISGSFKDNNLQIMVIDNGKGFDWSSVEKKRKDNYLKGGNGLLNIEHRANTIGAHCTWLSDHNGTKVSITKL